MDLLLELSGSRRRVALEGALRDAVRSGRLTPGTRLPSSRTLAEELGLARNTVSNAFGQLIAEGWLTAQQGAGTFVAERANVAEAGIPRGITVPRRAYDLSPGNPDLSGFPRATWSAASRRALTAAPNVALGYPDPRGLLSLRETLANYLARVRGVRTTPDRIVICSGFVQALSVLAGTLHQRGARSAALENYGVPWHAEVVERSGLALRFLPVDHAGAAVEELTAADAMAVLTPAHQFPFGAALAASRRAAVLRWARMSGGLIVEDDYDGEFRYDRRPLGAVQSLAPDLVAYVGTASKSLAPGLSLGWLVLPAALTDAVVETKRLSDGRTGIFEQLTLEEFIRTGAYDRHVRRSRVRYRQRRDRLVATMTARAPQVRITGIAAGLHAVLDLGNGLTAVDEPAVASRAARAGLTVRGLADYRHVADPSAPAALVIGYGTPPDHAFAGALHALCEALG